METVLNFNNREIAVLLWFDAFLFFILCQESVKKSLQSVFKCLSSVYIWGPLLLGVIWIGSLIWLLSEYEIWSLVNVKTTFLWTFAFAFYSMFKTSEIEFDKAYRAQLIKESLGLATTILFITSFYTLPLLLEFIFVPLATFFAITQVYAKYHSEYKEIGELSKNLLSAIGLTYLFYGIYGICRHPEFLFTAENLFEFVLPILLTLWYLPYLFAWKLLLVYEKLGKSLKRNLKNQELIRFSRLAIMWHLKWDIRAIERVGKILYARSVATRYEFIKVIYWTKQVNAREKYHTEDSDELGWAPVNAKAYLSDQGLGVKEYTNMIEGDWLGSSYKTIKESASSSSFSYYISGDEMYVKEFELTMSCYSEEDKINSETEFKIAILELIENAVKHFPSEYLESLSDLKIFSCVHKRVKVDLAVEKRPSGKIDVIEYTFKLKIE